MEDEAEGIMYGNGLLEPGNWNSEHPFLLHYLEHGVIGILGMYVESGRLGFRVWIDDGD